MPKTRLASALAAVALTASGLAVTTATAPAADAAWSRPGSIVKYHLCRGPANDGLAWRFVSKVTKRKTSQDSRARIEVLSGSDRKAGWRTGWVSDGKTRRAVVKVRKSDKVRVRVTMEAGDRDSIIGTASEMVMIKPKKIVRCNA